MCIIKQKANTFLKLCIQRGHKKIGMFVHKECVGNIALQQEIAFLKQLLAVCFASDGYLILNL